uniref:Uncharacterized protein n=2 Tax=Clastoptera arizonana TaxID=38151 RepID=A0A1B6C3F1_9HEMI
MQAERNNLQMEMTCQKSLQLENERLLKISESSTGEHTVALIAAQEQNKLLEDELNSTNNRLTDEIKELQSRLEVKENEVMQLERKWKDVQCDCDNFKQQLDSNRSELEQYKARAEHVLNNKEKLIAELRKSDSNATVDASLEMELQQLREEKNSMIEENERLSEQYEITRSRLSEVERTMDILREDTLLKQNKLQEMLSQQKKYRQIAEEDCKTRSDELHSVREELNRQCSLLASRLKDRENELTRLRAQLTQRPASPPISGGELEMRMSSLTKTLVQKQTALEALTTERNELRFQIEELELKHRQQIAKLNQVHQRHISANDTDDAKAQVPSFLIESPFDTGVTRRVKRAYSSLDAVGIRTGVFLRRYPLARIFVVFYVVSFILYSFKLKYTNLNTTL